MLQLKVSFQIGPSDDTLLKAPGIRRILNEYTKQSIPRGVPLPKESIDSIRMGTTVATNALLERKGTRHAFLVTKGFKDLIEIGYQSRPRLFDLNISKPEVSSIMGRIMGHVLTASGLVFPSMRSR